jgi:hypothetical protein
MGLLGAGTVMAGAEGGADAVEKARLGRGRSLTLVDGAGKAVLACEGVRRWSLRSEENRSGSLLSPSGANYRRPCGGRARKDQRGILADSARLRPWGHGIRTNPSMSRRAVR